MVNFLRRFIIVALYHLIKTHWYCNAAYCEIKILWKSKLVNLYFFLHYKRNTPRLMNNSIKKPVQYLKIIGSIVFHKNNLRSVPIIYLCLSQDLCQIFVFNINSTILQVLLRSVQCILIQIKLIYLIFSTIST